MTRALPAMLLALAFPVGAAPTVPAAGANAVSPGTNAVPAGTAAPWDEMILSVPGMRGAIPASPQEKAFTTPSLTLTETRIAGELQVPAERSSGMPADLLRQNLAEARLLLASNQVYQASRNFWTAHRASPGNEEAVEGLAICMLRANDNERAARMFEWLSTQHPANRAHRVNMACAFYQGGRHEAAVAELRRLIAEGGTPPGVLYYNLAMSLQALGDAAGALDALKACSSYQPSDPTPLMASARICARQGRVPEMLDHLRKARDLAEPEVYESLLQNAAFSTQRPAIRAADLNRGRPAEPGRGP